MCDQKREVENLERSLAARTASVAAHRSRVDRLQHELALLAARSRGLDAALADGAGEAYTRNRYQLLHDLRESILDVHYLYMP